jgi:hypothetical protein
MQPFVVDSVLGESDRQAVAVDKKLVAAAAPVAT